MSKESDTVEVPKVWIRALINSSSKINQSKVTIETESREQIVFFGQLAHLQGYIESAKYLLPTEDRTDV